MSTWDDIYEMRTPAPRDPVLSTDLLPSIEPTRCDLLGLVSIFLAALGVAAVAGWFDPMLGILAVVGGTLVTIESWFTAVTFLHRLSPDRPVRRWPIFVGALAPWLIGLGLAATLMWGLLRLAENQG